MCTPSQVWITNLLPSRTLKRRRMGKAKTCWEGHHATNFGTAPHSRKPKHFKEGKATTKGWVAKNWEPLGKKKNSWEGRNWWENQTRGKGINLRKQKLEPGSESARITWHHLYLYARSELGQLTWATFLDVFNTFPKSKPCVNPRNPIVPALRPYMSKGNSQPMASSIRTRRVPSSCWRGLHRWKRWCPSGSERWELFG